MRHRTQNLREPSPARSRAREAALRADHPPSSPALPARRHGTGFTQTILLAPTAPTRPPIALSGWRFDSQTLPDAAKYRPLRARRRALGPLRLPAADSAPPSAAATSTTDGMIASSLAYVTPPPASLLLRRGASHRPIERIPTPAPAPSDAPPTSRSSTPASRSAPPMNTGGVIRGRWVVGPGDVAQQPRHGPRRRPRPDSVRPHPRLQAMVRGARFTAIDSSRGSTLVTTNGIVCDRGAPGGRLELLPRRL